MKKIALFLTFALALSSVLTAADVSVGGWLETTGVGTALSGDGLSDDAKKATFGLGTTTLDLTVNVAGEGFGATATLETWLDSAPTLENKATSTSTSTSTTVAGPPLATTTTTTTTTDLNIISPVYTNTYVWSELAEGLVTIYAGLAMYPINYAPYASVEGEAKLDLGGWKGAIFTDQLGMGYGTYDYRGGGVTGGINGLVTEVKVDAFAAALVIDAGTTSTLESTPLKLNAKYSHELFDAYVGYATQNRDVSKAGFWLAGSLKAVSGLTTDLKLEMLLDPDASVTSIAANLGYSLNVVDIKTKLQYKVYGADQGDWSDNVTFDIQGKVAAMTIDVVDLALIGRYQKHEGKEINDLMAFGLSVGKSVGNVGNTLYLTYNTHQYDDNKSMNVSYAVNIWF